MTLDEFSVEFDIYFNNISSNKAPGLNELEKSILLTEAQEILVKELYNGTLDGNSFENTEEVAEYLRTLVKQEILTAQVSGYRGICKSSVAYEAPDDLLFITYEGANVNTACESLQEVAVIPTTQDEFHKTYRNPFRGPRKNRILRLLIGDKIELITKVDIQSYVLRYLKRPEPIVLKGITGYEPFSKYYIAGNECKMPEFVHRMILLKAVNLAKVTWS